MAPLYPTLRIGTITSAAIFAISDYALSSRVVVVFPVVPSFRNDMSSKLTVQLYGICIGTPRSSQEDFGNAFVSCKAAMAEDISILYVSWR